MCRDSFALSPDFAVDDIGNAPGVTELNSRVVAEAAQAAMDSVGCDLIAIFVSGDVVAPGDVAPDGIAEESRPACPEACDRCAMAGGGVLGGGEEQVVGVDEIAEVAPTTAALHDSTPDRAVVNKHHRGVLCQQIPADAVIGKDSGRAAIRRIGIV